MLSRDEQRHDTYRTEHLKVSTLISYLALLLEGEIFLRKFLVF